MVILVKLGAKAFLFSLEKFLYTETFLFLFGPFLIFFYWDFQLDIVAVSSIPLCISILFITIAKYTPQTHTNMDSALLFSHMCSIIIGPYFAF